MFNHLGYHLQGVGKGKVGLCAKVRPQVKTMFARCGGNIPTTLDDTQVFNSFPNIHVLNDVINNKSSGLFEDSSIVGPQVDGTQCCSMFKASMDDPIHMPNLPPCTFWQMTLHEGMNSTTKQNLDKKWATFFYEDNIQFNVTTIQPPLVL